MAEETEREERTRQVLVQSVIVVTVVTVVLVAFGVMMVYSATAPEGIRRALLQSGTSRYSVANKQLALASVGAIAAIVMAMLPMRVFIVGSRALFAGGALLQALVLTPLGKNVGGNTNWISLGPITIQPSEFLKLATIVVLAAELMKVRQGEPDWRKYKVPGIYAGIGLALILVGKDMGTAMMFTLVCVGMFWLAGLPGKYFAMGLGVGILGASAMVAASPSRLNRVTDYLNNLFSMPSSIAPSQSDFALWAFGSGGIGGSGLGTGAEKWPGNLAEAQTDFIFAVVGEELGLLGCLVVVALFVALGWALMQICRVHPSKFARLATGGVAVWICGQAIANMLVVTGVLPVFGVPLPFISQGGSSVMACTMAIGLAVSCAFAVPGVKDSFKVRASLVSRARVLVRKG